MFLQMPMYRPIMFFFLLSSIFMMMSSSNWFFIWVMMEMNLLLFIPLMMSSFSNKETEGAIKYFLIQAIGSCLILLTFMSNFNLLIPQIPFLIFIILLKLGAAPCHNWFPQVMNSLSWENCFILSTIQKSIPLFILVFFLKFSNTSILFIIIIMNSFIGGWGGLNQTQMRPLMAYSSIGHLSWMFGAMLISSSMTIIYFFIYSIISLSIFMNFMNTNQKMSSSFNLFQYLSSSQSSLSYLNILSLAGLPPFLGFFPKWIILSKLFINLPFMSIILIVGSLINLYYYLMIIINMLITSKKSLYMKNSLSTLLLLLSLAAGPILFLFYAMTMLY